MVVDEKLNFNQHIEEKITKGNQMLGIIRSTFKFINAEVFSLLYKSMVRPHVEYASVIWSPHTKKYTDMLERLQRRATKLVPELRDLPYEDRLRSLHLPTLQYRRLRNDLIHIYKITHNMIELDTDTHCKKCNHSTLMLQRALRSTNRGHSHKYQIHHHPGVRNRFLTTRALSYWNSLSDKTVNSVSLNVFKNNLSKESSLPPK